MTTDVKNKIKEIANRFCNMSFDEILSLPEPEGYEFIDQFYDQIVESRQVESDLLLNADFNRNDVVEEKYFAYKTIDVEKTDCKDSKDFVYEESDLIWAA